MMRTVKVVLLLFAISGSARAAEAPPSFVRAWGSVGSAPGQFYAPTAIGGDAAGNIYVSDGLNDRIQKFDANGNFLLQWGSIGFGPGQFRFPWGIDCDAAGNVYVSDLWNNRIQKFNGNGQFLKQWGGWTTNAPFLAIDELDRIYLGDGANRRILKFDSNGNLLDTWNTPDFSARGIAAAGGLVYAVDDMQAQVRVFDTQGNTLGTFGTEGFGDGELHRPWDVELDETGNLYVTSLDDCRISKFSPTHDVLVQWGTAGSGPGQFLLEQAVYVHPNRLIYVVDRQNGRVEAFEAGAVPAARISWGAIKANYR